MAEDRLSQDEVAMVLRRAAQLDGETAMPADETLPVAAIEAAAAEVGLAPAAVRQAVAELRSGLLADPAAPAPSGTTAIVEAAVVPLERTEALAAVGRWLGAQTFVRHRGRDGVEVWRLREDWFAGAQRAFDWSASVRLKLVRQVVVRAVTVDGGTLVRLEAELRHPVSAAPAFAALGGGAAGGATGVGTSLALGTGAPTVMAVGSAVAGFGMVSGWLAGRALRRDRRARVADELAAALDRLGSGTEDRNALERLRDRARRGGPWTRA